MLSVRKVEEKDIDLIFGWANDTFYRSMSKNQAPIEWDKHVLWFNQKALVNPYFFLFLVNGKEIGFVRFDKSSNWFITIYLDPSMRGQGYGAKILKEAISLFWKKERDDLFAEVNSMNLASLKIFKELNFEVQSQDKFYLLKKCVNSL